MAHKPRSRLLGLDRIRMLVMDVDGVMTDSGMYYTSDGVEFKKFNTRDGHGIELLREAGFLTAIITREDTPIVINRAKKLKIREVSTGIRDKLPCLVQLAKRQKLDLMEIAYIGDDLHDLKTLQAVGFSACPQDAVEEVRNNVSYVCEKRGGEGAVREICELLIKARNGELNAK